MDASYVDRARLVPLLAAMVLTTLWAGATTTQDVAVKTGWNAVWLEVSPSNASPGDVFAGTPVDLVEGFYPTLTTVEFISDPSDDLWKSPGWALWAAPGRQESAFNSLATLDGARGYLVHSLADTIVSVSGEPTCTPLRWTANSLNFTGFPVEAGGGLTFAAFFDGSAAHASLRAYRLIDGRWRRISSPSSATVEAGTAYWIYCTGRSDWQGPLEVDVTGADGIDFADVADGVELLLSNRGTVPLTAAITPTVGSLPLCVEQRDPADLSLSYPSLTPGLDLGTIATGMALPVRIQVRREKMTAVREEALLTVVGGGCLKRIPVRASLPTP